MTRALSLCAAATCASLLLAATPRPAPPQAAQPPAAPQPAAAAPRNIAGPGDYALRERLIKVLSKDPQLARERFSIVLVNGGAVFSGVIGTCAMKMRALRAAAVVPGIINVTDEMRVARGEIDDAALAKAVGGLLRGSATELGLQDFEVSVEDGVASLAGKVADYPSRVRAEELAGTVAGVVRISNRLLPADAPEGIDDRSLVQAVVAYLKEPIRFGLPSDIEVRASDGTVTLEGRVSLCQGRLQAAAVASLVRGVRAVDNRLRVDPGLMMRPSLVKAGP